MGKNVPTFKNGLVCRTCCVEGNCQVFAAEIFLGFAPCRRVLQVGPDAFSRGPATPRVGTLVLLLFGFLAGPAKRCDLQGQLGVVEVHGGYLPV